MKKFTSAGEIIDFAIQLEQDAVNFYKDLAKNSDGPEMSQVFEQFAREEMAHKSRLTEVSEREMYEMEAEVVENMQVSDYLVSIRPSHGMSYNDALVLAIKMEQAAFRLYMDLADKAPDEEMKQLFLSLALEESRHKLRFELEYNKSKTGEEE